VGACTKHEIELGCKFLRMYSAAKLYYIRREVQCCDTTYTSLEEQNASILRVEVSQVRKTVWYMEERRLGRSVGVTWGE
jgi:hypothetical protein